MQHGVDHDGAVARRARKQGRTFGDEGQHRRAQVPVQGQSHLCGAERRLVVADQTTIRNIDKSQCVVRE